jgi:hypothetical protein
MYRVFSMIAMALELAMCLGAHVLVPNNGHESVRAGKVVSRSGDKLVTSYGGSKEQTVTLAVDAKVTCDGMVCMAADLKQGMNIRVSTKSNDPQVAIRVEALDKDTEFEILREPNQQISNERRRLCGW